MNHFDHDTDELCDLIDKGAKFVPDSLHGFKFRDIRTAASAEECADLLTDNSFISVINRIAEKYHDLFLWWFFMNTEEKMSASLFYLNTNDINGGVEVEFSSWKDDSIKDVTIFASTKHDTGLSDAYDYVHSWDLEKVNTDTVACELLSLIETYLTEDFIKLYDVTVTQFD